MARKMFMFVISLIVLSIAFTSFAEEKESLVQKIRNKFSLGNKTQQNVSSKSPAVKEEVKAAVVSAQPAAVKPVPAKASKDIKEMSNEELIVEMRSGV